MSFVSAVPKFILTAVNPLVPDNKSSFKQNDGMYHHRFRVWDEVVETLLKELLFLLESRGTGWEWDVSTVLQSQQHCRNSDLPRASMLGRAKVKL